jgi:hypothetical protein
MKVSESNQDRQLATEGRDTNDCNLLPLWVLLGNVTGTS